MSDKKLREAVREYLAADEKVKRLAKLQNTYTSAPPPHVLGAVKLRDEAQRAVLAAAVEFVQREGAR